MLFNDCLIVQIAGGFTERPADRFIHKRGNKNAPLAGAWFNEVYKGRELAAFQIKAIVAHYFYPGIYEVGNKLLFRIFRAVHFSNGP